LHPPAIEERLAPMLMNTMMPETLGMDVRRIEPERRASAYTVIVTRRQVSRAGVFPVPDDALPVTPADCRVDDCLYFCCCKFFCLLLFLHGLSYSLLPIRSINNFASTMLYACTYTMGASIAVLSFILHTPLTFRASSTRFYG